MTIPLKSWPRERMIGCAVFLAAAVYIWWISGNLFNLGSDEGIYLEGGRLVAGGRVPYRDFFVLTGPLTFWLEGICAYFAGMNIPLLRIPMLLDLSFLTWAVYHLSARWESPKFAAGFAGVFLALIPLQQMVAKHRWDSAALATGAVLVAVAADERRSWRLWTLAGALAVTSAWATPSVGIIAVPLLVAALARSRREAGAFLGGAAFIGMIGGTYLASQHALTPMIDSMLWTARNYSQANAVPYGSILTGPETKPFLELDWPDRALRLLVWGRATLPATLPIAALLGWGWLIGRGRQKSSIRQIVILLASTVALVLSALPRWSSMQLAFVAAVPFALCGSLLSRYVSPHLYRAIYAATVLLAAISVGSKTIAAFDYIPMATRAGFMAGSPEDIEMLQQLEEQIPVGSSVLVFPYLPALYPLLDVRNPTRYLFLQPGMMTVADEKAVISDLAATPPEWVICSDIDAKTVLSVWPGSDPARIPLNEMQGYLQTHYSPVGQVVGKWGKFKLLKKNGDA